MVTIFNRGVLRSLPALLSLVVSFFAPQAVEPTSVSHAAVVAVAEAAGATAAVVEVAADAGTEAASAESAETGGEAPADAQAATLAHPVRLPFVEPAGALAVTEGADVLATQNRAGTTPARAPPAAA